MAKIQDIRNRTQRTNGTRKLSQIKYIVRHHSATETGHFDSFWDYWHNNREWGTGGYHEIILRDGTVQLCYDPEEITNGVLNMNTVCFHICLVGDGSFTEAQEKTWDERVKHYMDLLNIDVKNVKGHGELQSTTCPGIDMNVVRSRIKGTSVKPTPQPSKPSTSKPTPSNKGVVWVGATSKGKRVESIYKGSDKLNFYDGPRWNNPSGKFGYGEGWTIDNLYRVNGSLMYRVQNSKGDLYYITASENYVRVVGNSAPANKNVTSYNGDSIVDYLNLDGNKHLGGSSFNNRKKLAAKHGIKNYRGTAAQNTQLLNKLRG